MRTEDTYCFCCEYILSESMEEIPRKVSYAKIKLNWKVDSVSLDSKPMLKKGSWESEKYSVHLPVKNVSEIGITVGGPDISAISSQYSSVFGPSIF